MVHIKNKMWRYLQAIFLLVWHCTTVFTCTLSIFCCTWSLHFTQNYHDKSFVCAQECVCTYLVSTGTKIIKFMYMATYLSIHNVTSLQNALFQGSVRVY